MQPPPHADELLVIGRFARLAGLSVGALRHYDELDLLRPAFVDPVTGYRSYAAAASEWKARAAAALAGVADQDDRDVIEGDLATLPI